MITDYEVLSTANELTLLVLRKLSEDIRNPQVTFKSFSVSRKEIDATVSLSFTMNKYGEDLGISHGLDMDSFQMMEAGYDVLDNLSDRMVDSIFQVLRSAE